MSPFHRIQAFLAERGLAAVDHSAFELARDNGIADACALEEFFGSGPLRALLEDPGVSEILVNGHQEIWVERKGRLEPAGAVFSCEEALRQLVRRFLSSSGRKVDLRSPFADAVLPCGTRAHVAIPPLARRGICLSLRKFPREPWSLERWQQAGSMTAAQAGRLRELVLAGKNIFLCGATGTGKTSLLSALVGELPPACRVLALEDAAEIRSAHPHFLSLEARPPNQEGEGAIPLSRLLREALRMRPDRLVFGECRGPEAFDLLMALHTGHAGSMATIHANSARDALHRLETLALLAAENIGASAIRQLIASCIHAVVFLQRGPEGRRVQNIAELRGLEGEVFLIREEAAFAAH